MSSDDAAVLLLVLTGASGAGKTTLAKHIQDHHPQACQFFFFDAVGVPSAEEMKRKHGSGEQWQRAMTVEWIERIRPFLASGQPVLFEGQMRIAFLQEALARAGVLNAHVILVDCDYATRAAGLSLGRNQAELANADMMNWARFLRDEARAAGVEILDTGRAAFSFCVEHLMERLGRSR